MRCWSAMLVAVTALIPMFGAFIGCFVGAFLILVVDPMQALWFVVLFLVLQQIEGNLIYPRVVGSSDRSARDVGDGRSHRWRRTMGILGMLLMVPAASVIYALSRENTARRLIARQVPVIGMQSAKRKENSAKPAGKKKIPAGFALYRLVFLWLCTKNNLQNGFKSAKKRWKFPK